MFSKLSKNSKTNSKGTSWRYSQIRDTQPLIESTESTQSQEIYEEIMEESQHRDNETSPLGNIATEVGKTIDTMIHTHKDTDSYYNIKWIKNKECQEETLTIKRVDKNKIIETKMPKNENLFQLSGQLIYLISRIEGHIEQLQEENKSNSNKSKVTIEIITNKNETIEVKWKKAQNEDITKIQQGLKSLKIDNKHDLTFHPKHTSTIRANEENKEEFWI